MLCGRPSSGPGRQDHWSSEEEEDDDGISSRILAPHPIESDRPKHRTSRMIAISTSSTSRMITTGAMKSIPCGQQVLGVGWKLVSRGGRREGGRVQTVLEARGPVRCATFRCDRPLATAQ